MKKKFTAKPITAALNPERYYSDYYGIKVYLGNQFIGWYNRTYDSFSYLYICPSLNIMSKAKGAKKFTRRGDASGVLKRTFALRDDTVPYIRFTTDEITYVRGDRTDVSKWSQFKKLRLDGSPIIEGELSFEVSEFDNQTPDADISRFIVGYVEE